MTTHSLFLFLGIIVGLCLGKEAGLEIIPGIKRQHSIPSVNSVFIKKGLKVLEGDLVAPHLAQNVSRGGIYWTASHWPYNETSGHYEVPYVIADAYSKVQKDDIIIYAMRLLEKGTNVRFIERRPTDFNYLHIVSADGCWSNVGMMGGKQLLSLLIGDDNGSCMFRGTAVHELIHALGLGHEHQRPDRDDYIHVNWNNVVQEFRNQLVLDQHLDNGNCTGYDYASIMHYNVWGFGNAENAITMQPKFKEGIWPLQADKLAPSSCDWFELNEIYPRSGYKFKCERHLLPDAAVPINPHGCKVPNLKDMTCEYYCKMCYRCTNMCHLPTPFPPTPARTNKTPHAMLYEDCAAGNLGGGWNAAAGAHLFYVSVIAGAAQVFQLML